MLRHQPVRGEILERAEHAERGGCADEHAGDRAENIETPRSGHLSRKPLFGPGHYWRLTARRSIAAALLAALAGGAPQLALADGVVLKSTAADVPVGRVIRSGDNVDIHAGELVTIVERSGRMVELRKAGVYAGPPQDASGPSVAAAAAGIAQGPKMTAAMGAVRNEKTQACIAALRAKGGSEFGACFTEKGEKPRLDVGAAGSGQNGAPVFLRVTANFEGRAICVRRAQGGVAPEFLAGASPDRPMIVRAGLTTQWPERGGEPLHSDRMSPASVITCHALDEQSWHIIAPAAAQLTPTTAGSVISALSKIEAVALAQGNAIIAHAR